MPLPLREKVRFARCDPNDRSGFPGGKEEGLKEIERLSRRLEPVQELLHAEQRHRILVVLQGMDTSGKDGTIRRVFEGVNPQGVRVVQFKTPTPPELSHDFLWRAHQETPGTGELVIFNRSHYEDVLIARVHHLVPAKLWKRRFEEINDFERTLAQEGTTILKFYLHIDRDEQKKRLQDRLDDPTKRWKITDADLHERKFWPEYMGAYQDVLTRTNTPWAPWFLVPSNSRWYRDLFVSSVLVSTLEGLRMKYPAVLDDLKGVRIR